LGVVAEIFFAKRAGRRFTPVMEIKPNRVSLCWNFYYADIQLIRGRFWLQVWTVRVSWKYLAKIWKNSTTPCGFAAWMDGRTLL